MLVELDGMEKHVIACSLDQRGILDSVIERLNAKGKIRFEAYYRPDKEIIRSGLSRNFGILCPQSAISLQDLEDLWERHYGQLDNSIFAESISFGFTPVVFFMPPWTAEKYGVFKEPFGWSSLAGLTRDRGVRIRHASLQERDGIAVAVAQHIAFQTRTKEQEEPAEDIISLEQAVEEYGPDDDEVLRRAIVEGDWTTEVVIAQERSVIAAAQRSPRNKGVVVYPHDGLLLIPNTAVSLRAWEGAQHKEAFHVLANGLTALNHRELGRTGLHKDAQSLASSRSLQEFVSAAGLEAGQTLRWAPHAGTAPVMLPGRRAVRGIRSLASSAKRGVDVCLLFDSSGSMSKADKFPKAQAAIDEFIRLLQGPASRACLIRFQSQAVILTPLRTPSSPFYPPGSLNPDGGTALLDAVDLGIDTLENFGNRAHIWAIVAFTDGEENSSRVTIDSLERRLRGIQDIRFYGIAYGSDADMAKLSALASVTGGMAVRGDPATILAVYERLSTYV
jgi:Mg-chelatase subunit ChlD